MGENQHHLTTCKNPTTNDPRLCGPWRSSRKKPTLPIHSPRRSPCVLGVARRPPGRRVARSPPSSAPRTVQTSVEDGVDRGRRRPARHGAALCDLTMFVDLFGVADRSQELLREFTAFFLGSSIFLDPRILEAVNVTEQNRKTANRHPDIDIGLQSYLLRRCLGRVLSLEGPNTF